MATKKNSKKVSKKVSKTQDAEVEDKNSGKATTMKVSRKDAQNILKALGFNNTHKYANSLLLKRMDNLATYVKGYDGTLSGDLQEFADQVIAAGAGNIEVTGAEPTGAVAGVKKSSSKKTSGKKDTAKKSSSKKPSSKKGKKRLDCLCDALRKLPKSGKTLEDVAANANDDYIKAGGDDNAKQSLHHLMVILPALVAFDIVKVEDGKVFPGA